MALNLIVGTCGKSPVENKDFGFDWSPWLGGSDTIASSSWSVPSGLSAGSSSNTTTQATQYVGGGSPGQDYLVTNTITTAAGRIGQRGIRIQVRSAT